ncbi:hypothetical protein LCGC14_1673850 [marine sediment metagenome]|uniref:N-acetyltransferase domain-containing protein n=1 Tax=marine sediment metagenome TaxID=412755 RepID=A0A0F9HQK5_9ZZZZ
MDNELLIKIVENKKEYLKCIDIRKKVFIEEQQIPKLLESDELENTTIHFLVYIGRKAVATGRFRVKDPFLKFERIAVLKEFRKMHLGSKLLKYMQKVGYEKYERYLQIAHVQKSAVDFYKKNDFKLIGESFKEANIDHYLMIHIIEDRKYIKNLICFNDPKCDKNIQGYLSLYLK